MIAVLDYGIGNLRSAEKALQQVGGDARLVTDPADAEGAAGVVLPGVGAFGALHGGAAVERPRQGGARGDRRGHAVPRHLRRDADALRRLGRGPRRGRARACCAGTIRLLPDGVKRPQMQWNRLDPVRADSALLAGLGPEPWVYFVHSYAADGTDDVVATCDYGGPVVAAVERGPAVGDPVPPREVRAAGLRLLANFVAVCRSRPGAGHDGPLPGDRPAGRPLRPPGPGRLRPGDRVRRRPGRGGAGSFEAAGARWIHVVDLDAARRTG